MKFVLYSVFFVVLVGFIFSAVVFFAYPLKFRSEINHAAQVFGVDKVLIASVINAESGFNKNAVSSKGAVGLMQVMPSTADFVATKINVSVEGDGLYDPKTNILVGTFYLKYLIDKFGDIKTALIAYNAGEGNVANWLENEKYVSYFDNKKVLVNCPFKQTNAYVEKVLNGLNFYKLRF